MSEAIPSSRRRTVLVTGAAGAIGQAIARAFAADGLRTILLDQDDAVRAVARNLDGDHVGLVVDLASEQAVEATRARIEAGGGSVDILVNNAAVALLALAKDYPTSDWDETMTVNLRGAFLCARTFAPGMLARGWGRIINIASQNAECGVPAHVAYSTAKAGLLGMTRVMAVEWAAAGVTVNAVSPTLVDTAMSRATWTHERRAGLLELIPAGRLATVDDVVAAACFLASDGAGMITGQNIPIDGGSSIVT